MPTPAKSLRAEIHILDVGEFPKLAVTPELVTARLAEFCDLLDRYFASLPRSGELPVNLGDLIWENSSHSNTVRPVLVTTKDGVAEQKGELFHFNSSPEIWVACLLGSAPESQRYLMFSWYGMHDPAAFEFNRSTLTPGCRTIGHPIEDLSSLISTCEAHVEDLEVKAKIKGTPAFSKDTGISEMLSEAKSGGLSLDAASVLAKLPREIAECQIRAEEEVFVTGIGPYNRTDLKFFDADKQLNYIAVKSACPTFVELFEFLDEHGFKPMIQAQVFDRADSIPYLSLRFPTKAGVEKIEFQPD